MQSHILVTYATVHGSTAGIAGRIGQILKEQGHRVDVLPVSDSIRLADYDAVILGSAVYIGQWCKTAQRFLRTHQDELASKPTWLFSTGPTGEGDPVELVNGWNFPDNLGPIADAIKPRDIAVFHGMLDNDKLDMIQRMMIRKVKAPMGDFRDWNAIEAWATSIAEAMPSPTSQPQ